MLTLVLVFRHSIENCYICVNQFSINVLKIFLFLYFKVPDVEEVTVTFEPSFSDVTEIIHEIIEHMVKSVQAFQCVEHQLFYEDEGLKKRYISSVQLDEERVLVAKARVADVVEKNTAGPLK